MRVVHTVASLMADHGGPSRSVSAIAAAVASAGAESWVVTSAPPPGADTVRPPAPVRTVEAMAPGVRDAFGGTRSAFGLALLRILDEGPRSVIYDNGLWLPANHVAASVARHTRVPLVSAPKGMLSAWALNASRLKKKAAWAIYQRRDLEHAQLLHVTAEMELADVRAAGLRTPTAVVPHGVTVPPDLPGRQPGPVRQALFLSRVHPKKGLLNLLHAWAEVRPPGWALRIAGPDEGGHQAELEALVSRLSLGGEVSFSGAVEDERKWEVYGQADLFVLPTHSENFGIVVAEALAAGVPVITTTAAPWHALRDRELGWWIEIGVAPLVEALRTATALSPERLRSMGAAGRAYARETLSWERAAHDLLSAYAWLLDGGPKPSCVHTE